MKSRIDDGYMILMKLSEGYVPCTNEVYCKYVASHLLALLRKYSDGDWKLKRVPQFWDDERRCICSE